MIIYTSTRMRISGKRHGKNTSIVDFFSNTFHTYAIDLPTKRTVERGVELVTEKSRSRA